jgi:hypothetical protein
MLTIALGRSALAIAARSPTHGPNPVSSPRDIAVRTPSAVSAARMRSVGARDTRRQSRFHLPRDHQYPGRAHIELDDLERFAVGIEDQRPVELVVLSPVRLPSQHPARLVERPPSATGMGVAFALGFAGVISKFLR